MTSNRTLTRKQRAFVLAVASTSSVHDAAIAANIAPSTAWRYLNDGAVKSEIAMRQDAMLAQVCAGMASDMTASRKTLRMVMRDTSISPGVRVRAAVALLDAGLRMAELVALSERVSRLEERMTR